MEKHAWREPPNSWVRVAGDPWLSSELTFVRSTKLPTIVMFFQEYLKRIKDWLLAGWKRVERTFEGGE